MDGKLQVSLLEVSVERNGRPFTAPRPMDVGLVLQLVNPVAGTALALDSVTFRALPGETFPGSQLGAAVRPGDPLPLFKGPVAVPDAVLLDVRFVVFYQNDLGPIVGAVVNKLVDLAAARIPVLGDLASRHLHLKLESRVAEEYGRQSVLVNTPAEGPGPRSVALALTAPETIRGFYMADATGRSAPRPAPPAVFIEEGETAATAVLELRLLPPAARKARKAAAKRAPRARR